MIETADQINDLAARIRESARTKEQVQTELATSQRIIARVTDGIYREPWAAFRELIANSYDADATRVVIETGQPDFQQVIVRDNGNGMSPDTLAYVLRSIGGSSKRTATGVRLHTSAEGEIDHSPHGRPLIGKIGIGLFAVAQLTQHFQIITKASGEDIRTSATVKLTTHDEDKLGEQGAQYVAGTVVVESEPVPESERGSHGTSVVLYALRPEIRRVLQSVRRWEATTVTEGADGKPVSQPPLYHIGSPISSLQSGASTVEARLPWRDEDDPRQRFERLLDAASEGSSKASKPANLEHFDEYLRLIWKLSLSLPLQYIHQHPFDMAGDDGVVFFGVPEGRAQAPRIEPPNGHSLRTHFGLSGGGQDPCGGFAVFVDGMQLFRPIDLPKRLLKRSRVGAPVMMIAKEAAPFKKTDLDRAGGSLSFEAYLYWNSKIVPKDTVGVLLRVRGASGTLFDPSFLNYQVSEQTRLRQITSEIFVHDGLDTAINIDRESFNYSHPHFLYIQRWLHKALRLLVNRLKALADEDLQRERDAQEQYKRRVLAQTALQVWTARLGESSDLPIERSDEYSAPSEVGTAEIDWAAIPLRGDPERASALAVVLEAYGVLSTLTARDRAALINDILSVLDETA